MKLIDLVRKLDKIVQENPAVAGDAEVVFRPPGGMGMMKAEFTLTYITERRDGTTWYDQVPVVCIEVEDGQS